MQEGELVEAVVISQILDLSAKHLLVVLVEQETIATEEQVEMAELAKELVQIQVDYQEEPVQLVEAEAEADMLV